MKHNAKCFKLTGKTYISEMFFADISKQQNAQTHKTVTNVTQKQKVI